MENFKGYESSASGGRVGGIHWRCSFQAGLLHQANLEPAGLWKMSLMTSLIGA